MVNKHALGCPGQAPIRRHRKQFCRMGAQLRLEKEVGGDLLTAGGNALCVCVRSTM